mgnify:CR=1 FL=1|tara:strand:+ start:1476 stop:2123 length:648 start_codon:yes stop_codon:yes gene_type:complete
MADIKRPQEWDSTTITSGWTNAKETIKPVNEKDMNEFLELIIDLESRGHGDSYQIDGALKQRGAGLFQLETGPEQGGMTRLRRAYTKLPAHLTPEAMHRHYKESNKGNKSYDVKARLYPHQQKFLMIANIMTQEGGRKKYDEWVSSGKKNEKFIDWWIDHHWAGKKDEKPKKRLWANAKLMKEGVKKNLKDFFSDEKVIDSVISPKKIRDLGKLY